tara:strand:+ start:2280 stop:2804 length:525 start_codon:yes stop_codon:yes gene_type:complete
MERIGEILNDDEANIILKSMNEAPKVDFKKQDQDRVDAESKMKDKERLVGRFISAQIKDTVKGKQVIVKISIITDEYKDIVVTLFFQIENESIKYLQSFLKKLGKLEAENTLETLTRTLDSLVGNFCELEVRKTQKGYTNYYARRFVDSEEEALALSKYIKADQDAVNNAVSPF